ncbi:hypothetical protein EVAR_67212_1 [Eumeta japonica]|uniref:Uncharacterized protein n=1 Tax=Eumeta variegata TaxID=151549 RepID=A0A4C2A5A8_EUMVA|nr:hypothetical protein EVAR_67212_1 [Eumeta japonica]
MPFLPDSRKGRQIRANEQVIRQKIVPSTEGHSQPQCNRVSLASRKGIGHLTTGERLWRRRRVGHWKSLDGLDWIGNQQEKLLLHVRILLKVLRGLSVYYDSPTLAQCALGTANYLCHKHSGPTVVLSLRDGARRFFFT